MYDMLNFKYYAGLATNTYWKVKSFSNVVYMDPFDEYRMAVEKYWLEMASKVNTMIVDYINMVDFGQDIFRCCDHPAIVCVDGIVLSVKNDRIKRQGLTKPWLLDGELKTRFSDRKYRNLITFKKEDREILRSYIREGLK
jgi:hypothetical protein